MRIIAKVGLEIAEDELRGVHGWLESSLPVRIEGHWTSVRIEGHHWASERLGLIEWAIRDHQQWFQVVELERVYDVLEERAL